MKTPPATPHSHASCSHGCSHDHKHDHDHHDHDHKHDHDAAAAESAAPAAATTESADDSAWNQQFLLFLEMLVLIMIAAVIAYFIASGRIDGAAPNMPYLQGYFKILALIGGLALAVMGIFNFLMRRRAVGCSHDHDHHDHSHNHSADCSHSHDHDHSSCSHDHSHQKDAATCCSHDHSHDHQDHSSDAAAHAHHHHGSPMGRAAALLFLSGSITAAAVLTPDEFSPRYMEQKARALMGRSNGAAPASAAPVPAKALADANAAGSGLTLALVEKYQPRNKDGNFELGVMQLYYSGSDEEYARVMKDQPVETIGQVVKDEVVPGANRLRVFVLQVTCCAADARPYSIPVVFDGPLPEYQEMGWYKITGTVNYADERGVRTAVLKASSMAPSLRPKDQRATV